MLLNTRQGHCIAERRSHDSVDQRYLCELRGFARTALEVLLAKGMLKVHLAPQRLLSMLLFCLQS